MMTAAPASIRAASLSVGLLLIPIVSLRAPAAAQLAAIGASVKVERIATGTLVGIVRKLADKSDVFVDDLLRTEAESLARLVFLDETNLSLGPLSQVKLDRFVFDPDAGAQSVSLGLARGAFRFVTGNSDPRAF